MTFAWFRMHRSILQSRKIMQLSPERFRAWVLCMCMVEGDDGRLPSIEDIAFGLRASAETAEAILNDLIEARLIDIQPDSTLTIHKWSDYQYRKSDHNSVDRVRKHRIKKAASKQGVTLHQDTEQRPGNDFASESVSDSVPKSPTVEVVQEVASRTRGGARARAGERTGARAGAHARVGAYARAKGGE